MYCTNNQRDWINIKKSKHVPISTQSNKYSIGLLCHQTPDMLMQVESAPTHTQTHAHKIQYIHTVL